MTIEQADVLAPMTGVAKLPRKVVICGFINTFIEWY